MPVPPVPNPKLSRVEKTATLSMRTPQSRHQEKRNYWKILFFVFLGLLGLEALVWLWLLFAA